MSNASSLDLASMRKRLKGNYVISLSGDELKHILEQHKLWLVSDRELGQCGQLIKVIYQE